MLREEQPAGPAGAEQRPDWPGLTVEAVIYAVLFVGATFIRLYDLGRWPLLTGEAAEALAAWRFLHAQSVSTSTTPFLFGSALASFFVFGGGDVAARLVPALLGTGLVLLPLAFRHRLGSWGAIAATFALAFSPSLVFYSRSLAGPVPALAGAGAVLVAAELAVRRRLRPAAVAGAAGLAVGLTSSPWAYTFLVAALLFLGLGSLAKHRGVAWSGWEAGEEAMRAAVVDRWAWGALAIPLGLISTVFLIRPGGLQSTADLLAAWLQRLSPGSMGHTWAYGLGLLAFYEPTIVALGLAGLVSGLRRGDRWAGFLGLWAGASLLPGVISGARDGEAMAFVALPLVLLSGLAVSRIAGGLRPAQRAWVAGCASVFVVLLGLWWWLLPQFGRGEAIPVEIRGQVVDLLGPLVVATPLVLVACGIILYFWAGRAETVGAVAIVGLALGASLLLHQGVNLNFSFGRDAREPLIASPSAVELRDMASFLEHWSVRQVGDQHELTVVVGADLEPLVPWYLKEFPSLRIAQSPLVDAKAGAILARSDSGHPDAAGYVSTRFRLRTSCDAPLAMARDTLAWWLVRERGGKVQAETLELWVKP